MRDFTVERLEFDIVDHAVTAGPKAELAVRQLTNMVLSAGDTMITGSLIVVRNRHRGQWRPGWVASCRAIKDGQAAGYGNIYSVAKKFAGDEYEKPTQFRFDWKDA